MTPADAATVMHFYSGQLMQFASGVDNIAVAALMCALQDMVG
jgi:hypothetical protein